MTNAEQREAARRFINNWRGKGYEKGDTQRFWMSFLSDVLDMDYVADKIEFEKEVVIDGQTKFIDAYIAETKVLIEQKSLTKDLNKAIPQSGGKMLTPYEQAKNYANNMPIDDAPRWIVTCNFEEFHVYDMNKPGVAPEIIMLENLQTELYRFSFLLNDKNDNVSKEMEISIQAGELVGNLYDALLKEYKDPTNDQSLKSLNALCVRLVFCLYAEDAGIFGRHGMFHDYLMRFEIRDLRKALIELFQVLDIKPEDRDPYMDEDLAVFPYVNGGLFSDQNIEIPQLTEEIRELILKKASEDFDWSEISPTIFGAVFESTLNPETRRAGGMHYTSIENIHKVIDPLFLEQLKEDLEDIRNITVAKTRRTKLEDFHNKLAGIQFLDPACGSGNFLTESYISLRKIENELLKMKIEVEKGQVTGQIMMGDLNEEINPIRVSIGQFYGIEINDFAVTVAKTALWIAESQMLKATEDIVHKDLNFLPLKSYANIVEGNALRMDWNDVISHKKLDYIMGNPPFVGGSMMSSEQKQEAVNIFGKIRLANSLDYVCAWYFKAAEYIYNTKIEVAFVSTNSITQGEQVAPLWGNLISKYEINIKFAYRTFIWDSEANIKAHVHCVIIGFCYGNDSREKRIYEGEKYKVVENVSPYLIDAPDVIVDSHTKPICDVPICALGNTAKDKGYLLLTEEEKDFFVTKYHNAKKLIRHYVGGRDFLHNDEKRYCFWLRDVKPSEFSNITELRPRLEKVREFREQSTSKDTRIKAATPYLFFRTPHIESDYIIIPRTTSERRRYIPAGFMSKDSIGSDALMTIYDAQLYHFAIIVSNVHMAWMRTVAGRLKSDYRYSGVIVYNSFPWPEITTDQKEILNKTAQGILNARALYPESSLAELYDPLFMPTELQKAHQANDRAVMQAYGFNIKEMSEADCVAELMKMYQELTK